MIVDLDQQDWQQVVNILGSANAPWIVTNPLILRITQQINKQTQSKQNSIAATGDGHGIPAQSN